MLARLSAKWAARVSQPASGRPSEDGAAANDDVVEERLVRELTREHLQLLLNMADKPSPEPGQGAAPAGDLPGPCIQGNLGVMRADRLLSCMQLAVAFCLTRV